MFLVRIIFLILLTQLLFANIVFAQIPADTIPAKQDDSEVSIKPVRPIHKKQTNSTYQQVLQDSLFIIKMIDSIVKRPVADSGWKPLPDKPFQEQYYKEVYKVHPYFGFGSDVTIITSDKRQFQGKEPLFYSLTSLLLLFAFLRQAFPKYLDDIYRLFFRTTLKQRQIKEQLIETPLPSLLLNFFFFVVTGLYVAMLLQYFNLSPFENLWILFLYCSLALAIMYSIKFVTLKFSGWIFNMKEAAESYIFIVFIVNKIIGIYLLPFLILLAFTEGDFHKIALFFSWLGILGLYIYRFILTYHTVRNQIKVNPFHFFIYLMAFEIIPLLLIYKVLLIFF